MRFSNCLVLFTAIYLLCVAILAAADPAPVTRSGTNPAEPPWGAAVAGLHLRVSLDKSAYRPLEPIRCQIEIENTGPHKARVQDSYNSLRLYTFNVGAPNGEKSPLTLWGKAITAEADWILAAAPYLPPLLVPGKIHAENPLILNRAFDMTLEGKYVVTVHRKLEDPLDGSKEITLDSNTVTITIADPPPRQETPTTKPKVWP